MSSQHLEKTLRVEIAKLNDLIDEKIIKGLSYAKESRRHKFLLINLANLRRSTQYSRAKESNWFLRSFSVMSSFIF